MPLFDYKIIETRLDGRIIVQLSNGKRAYRARIIYCNTRNLTLDDIKGKLVHHIDENKSNDDPKNLELVTHKQHGERHPDRASGTRNKASRKKMSLAQKIAWRNGKYKNKKVNTKTGPRISKDVMESIKSIRDIGMSWSKLSTLFGIKRTTIRRVYDFMKGI